MRGQRYEGVVARILKYSQSLRTPSSRRSQALDFALTADRDHNPGARMGAILDGVLAEFSDLSVVQGAQLSVRLLIAAVLGGLIGRDRERAGKAAGIRTHLLVAVGSAAFVAVPQQSGATPADITRVIQGLVAGIGFLGAGCIWKDDTDGRVEGLTTAAGLWLTAAVGAAAGAGREVSALLVGLSGLFALSILGRWGVRDATGATPQGQERPPNKR